MFAFFVPPLCLPHHGRPLAKRIRWADFAPRLHKLAASRRRCVRMLGPSDNDAPTADSEVSRPMNQVISRRELTVVLVYFTAFVSFIIAFQRRKSLQLCSLRSVLGVLDSRIPPQNPDLVKNFAIEGSRYAHQVDLSKLIWVNTREKPQIKDKIVILVLWRASDSSSPSTFSILDKKLGSIGVKRGTSGVEVLAAHVPKFDREQGIEFVKDASESLRLRCPSASDASLNVWKSSGASTWPTVMILSPNSHRVIFALSGSDALSQVTAALTTVLDVYSQYKLNKQEGTSLYTADPDLNFFPSPLFRPSFLCIDKKKNRIFISDSGNNRILICSMDGVFIDQIGGYSNADTQSVVTAGIQARSKTEGLRDGNFQDCLFRNPQGIAYDSERGRLAVVDSGNNAIRLVCMEEETVSTVPLSVSEPSANVNEFEDRWLHFRAPVDVTFMGSEFYVTVSGRGQVWKVGEEALVHLSGDLSSSGHADADDLSSAMYSRPTGITTFDESALLVVESDSSTVREVDVAHGKVRTVVGGDTLFPWSLAAFGDRNGFGASVRLQNPRGICSFKDSKFLISDMYNNKIKLLVPQERECRLYCGTGVRGIKDGNREVASFNRPGGLAFDDNLKRVYIADTGNNVIRVVDDELDTVTTMKFSNFPESIIL